MSVHCLVKRALEMRVRERCLCVIAIFSICFWCSITTRVSGHSASVMSDTDPGAANPIPGVIPCPDPFLQDFVISVIICQAQAQHSTLSKSNNFIYESEHLHLNLILSCVFFMNSCTDFQVSMSKVFVHICDSKIRRKLGNI